MGVLLVSTEPADLVEACDRILVLHPGRPPQEMRTEDADEVLEAIYSPPVPRPTPEHTMPDTTATTTAEPRTPSTREACRPAAVLPPGCTRSPAATR